MAAPLKTLEELLVRHGAVAEEQLVHAREEQAKWGGDLGRTLVDLGYITEELLLRAMAHQQRIPWVAVDDPAPSKQLASALSLQLCERFGVIAVAGDLRARVLRVATSDPANEANLKALASATGFSIQPAAAMQEWIDRAIRTVYYGDEHLPAAAATDEPPLVEAEEIDEGDQLAELRGRVERLEAISPGLAALAARVERVEQLAVEDNRAVRVLTGLLVDLGFITRAELQQRLKK